MNSSGAPAGKCLWCKEEIAEGARICKTCKKHQSVWVELAFITSGFVGLVTFLIGVWVYAGERIYEAYNGVFGVYDVEIVEMVSDQYLVLRNTGTHPAYVSDVEFDLRPALDETQVKNINKLIEVGEIATLDLARKSPSGEKYIRSIFAGKGSDPKMLEQVSGRSSFDVIYYLGDSADLKISKNKFSPVDAACSIRFSTGGDYSTNPKKYECHAFFAMFGLDRDAIHCEIAKALNPGFECGGG